jgi:ADP-ribosylglycohydrolase
MMTPDSPLALDRLEAALRNQFVADALAMPVHWYYNPADIDRAFPGGVQTLEAAPARHPSSIMPLHSTQHGGRGAQGGQREIVGDVILKGRRPFWGVPGMHYHQGMQAGETTLNAQCTRVLLSRLAADGGRYDAAHYLDDYIAFMTAEQPLHNDTYAESWHRGFFANLQRGLPPERCGAQTHDTASVGGLVSIAALFLLLRRHGATQEQARARCRQHLFLSHPDESLGKVCDDYVALLDALLLRDPGTDAGALLQATARGSRRLDLAALVAKGRDDRDIVGRVFSSACYISDSWPAILYLAYKYRDNPRAGLLANANAGGDNVHRGAVLGGLFGLIHARAEEDWFAQLQARDDIAAEILAAAGG